MNIVKIKSTDKESQGDFVIINKDDFDDKKHELYVEIESETAELKPTAKRSKGE